MDHQRQQQPPLRRMRVVMVVRRVPVVRVPVCRHVFSYRLERAGFSYTGCRARKCHEMRVARP
jgi:hypothetical protein